MFRRSIQLKTFELLGEGSQGRVFKALRVDTATGLRQLVALKVLHSETAVELWRQEFESLAQVRSPYCVQVLSFERFGGRPALVMEFVEGASLATLMQGPQFSLEETAEIATQLEQALRDLQSQGLGHGDLSPHNVMLDVQGRVRVLDFGWANRDRLTLDFAAPERLNGQPAGLASDLFSLGRLCEHLSGVSDPWTSYLALDPALRSFRAASDLSAANGSCARLAERVRDWQKQNFLSLKQKTMALQNEQRPKAWIFQHLLLGAITAALLVAPPRASSARHNLAAGAAATVKLRTKCWHRFWLNGRPLGYAPLNIVLNRDQSYQLEWQSARGRGVRQLRPQADVWLQDSDFSH